MKLTLLILTLLTLNYANAQTPSGSNTTNDTTCFLKERAEFYVKHAEKYFIIKKSSDEQDTLIHNLEQIIQKKDVQLQLTSTIINGQAVKIKRLKWLTVGLGSGVGILTLLYFLK